ncbi:cytochrome P450 3A56-like [Mizuhopecten yessoensis]|uniref:cytochrome P450 3A56-like n=1 Tax=Mizuhopecten yessoensis TaxID=6573 RepID=UPI000B45F37C|nr:cytochrome P450 3A56-like [Mizuhopecten yessoensis]
MSVITFVFFTRTFEGKYPVLNIGKPELIKEILVKDFSSFVNRRDDFNAALEEPMDQMLTQLQNDHWKFVRRTLTPGFSGRKLRGMTDLINLAIERLLEKLKDKVNKGEDVELKEWFEAYTLESLSSTAFGMQIDSQKNPDNPFLVTIKKFIKPSIKNFLILITVFYPFTASLVRRISARNDWCKVFTDAVLQTMKHREENPGVRHLTFSFKGNIQW